MTPAHAAGGTLVELTIEPAARNSADRTDSIVSASGTMADEPLHFRPSSGGKLQALGAVPIAVSDSLVALVRFVRVSGVTDSLRLFARYPHQAPSAASGTRTRRAPGARRLRVDPVFTKQSAENDARVDRENDLAREIGRKTQDTPQLWTLPFLHPRPSRVTSRFGSGRMFNGRVSSSHLGIDFRGQTGEPIYAANRGVVALVAEFFLAGNVVYVDHGDGVMTGYFHMSKPEVAVGDTVERGQEIGLVGATGRVTGPHLHFSARFGALTIDPADLFVLKEPFVRIPLRKEGRGAGEGGSHTRQGARAAQRRAGLAHHVQSRRGPQTSPAPASAAQAVSGWTMSECAPAGGPPFTMTWLPSRLIHAPFASVYFVPGGPSTELAAFTACAPSWPIAPQRNV
ncbi:MAG TPA: M23 family metallopeptidase [Gemmatimonadaceae bacterium]|nr:M23 family metallopeptidase [Gemmatimonadaceae bacterium]